MCTFLGCIHLEKRGRSDCWCLLRTSAGSVGNIRAIIRNLGRVSEWNPMLGKERQPRSGNRGEPLIESSQYLNNLFPWLTLNKKSLLFSYELNLMSRHILFSLRCHKNSGRPKLYVQMKHNFILFTSLHRG